MYKKHMDEVTKGLQQAQKSMTSVMSGTAALYLILVKQISHQYVNHIVSLRAWPSHDQNPGKHAMQDEHFHALSQSLSNPCLDMAGKLLHVSPLR